MPPVSGRHDPPREWPAKDTRHGDASEEHRSDFPAPGRREPVGQVKDDTGEESGLSNPQQESQHVEHGGRLYEHHTG
ncbi:hypothetical protein D3C79_921740 [compost metagenome]